MAAAFSLLSLTVPAQTGWTSISATLDNEGELSRSGLTTDLVSVSDLTSCKAGSHKFETSGVSDKLTISGTVSGKSVAYIKFKVGVKVPANTTYEVQHTFLTDTYHTGSFNWSFSEIYCWDDKRDSPADQTTVYLDGTARESGNVYTVSNSRAFAQTDGYKGQATSTHTLKYINGENTEQVIYKYFVFLAASSGTGSYSACCQLTGNQYVETLVPMFSKEDSYTYSSANNVTSGADGYLIPTSRLKSSPWMQNASKSTTRLYGDITNDNRTLTLQQTEKSMNAQVLVQVFAATLNIPAASDYMARYNFYMKLGKVQNSNQTNGNTRCGVEMIDLGEDPNALFTEVQNLYLGSNSSVYSCPGKTAFRCDTTVRGSFGMGSDNTGRKVNMPLFVRYTNRESKAATKKHYFAVVVYNYKSNKNYPLRVVCSLQMENYKIYPTVSVGNLNQYVSNSAISNLSLESALSKMGEAKETMEQTERMSLTYDPRIIEIGAPKLQQTKATMAYLPYTLSETLEPGLSEVINLYDYRITMPGSSCASANAYQVAELFDFGTGQPSIESINVARNNTPSSEASAIRVVHGNQDQAEVHRLPVLYSKTGSPMGKEVVDNQMALILAGPTTAGQQPSVELKMSESKQIYRDASMWIEPETPATSTGYSFLRNQSTDFMLGETDKAQSDRHVLLPFRLSMFLSPNTTLWQKVELDMSMCDENIAHTKGYMELFSFGDSDRSSAVTPNTGYNAVASSDEYSVRRLTHQLGNDTTRRTVTVVLKFENTSASPRRVDNYLALLTGATNNTADHQFRTSVEIKSNAAIDPNNPSVFVDNWEDTYGCCAGSGYKDVAFKDLGRDDDGWFSETASGRNSYSYFEDPQVTTGAYGSVVMNEQVNNANNGQFVKFSLACLVPPHTVVRHKPTFYLGAIQNTDANPAFMAELFSFGSEDRSDELVLNVVGELDANEDGTAAKPVNCFASDYAYSQGAIFGTTAFAAVGLTLDAFEVEFRNDTDEPRLVRNYMGMWAFCQYAEKEAPWYAFWEDDKPLQHKLMAALYYYNGTVELNPDASLGTVIKNVSASGSGFNQPISGRNFIATQETGHSDDATSQKITFDVTHPVKAGVTDNVELKFRLRNLVRNPMHLAVDLAEAKVSLAMQGREGKLAEFSHDENYSPFDKTYTVTVPYENPGSSDAEISHTFELDVQMDDDYSHLSLLRLDMSGEILFADGDYEYSLYSDNGETCARLIKSNTRNDLNVITLPQTATYEGTAYPVRSLGTGALNNLAIVELTIPANIREIQSGAFVNCNVLYTLEFAEDPAGYPCTVYAGHAVGVSDDNIFGYLTTISYSSGSVAEGCPNLQKVIFNRTVNGAEPNGNAIMCSPFVRYNSDVKEIKDVTLNVNGFMEVLSTVMGISSLGTYVVYDYYTPVQEFVFTDKARYIGNYCCYHAAKCVRGKSESEVKITIDPFNGAAGEPHFYSLGYFSLAGTKIRHFDMTQANYLGDGAFSGTPMKKVTITPNVTYVGGTTLATDSLLVLRVESAQTPVISYGSDRWAGPGLLPEGFTSGSYEPQSGEWEKLHVTFLDTLDVRREITPYTYGCIPGGVGPFQAAMFEQNADYAQYHIGNEVKSIPQGTYKNNNFEYFDIGDGVQSIGTEGVGTASLHSLKIGRGLTTLASNAFRIQKTYVAQEWLDQLLEDVEATICSDTWWNDFLCLYEHPNIDFNSILSYYWTEWTDEPIIHDIYCTALASRQATPETSIDCFGETTYQTCQLHYTSPGLNLTYPWYNFANAVFTIPMDEDQLQFTCCEDEPADSVHHEFSDVEVSLARTITKGWNTVCLPFDCPLDALGAGLRAFLLTGVDYNASSGQAMGSFDLNFTELAVDAQGDVTLSANVPYLVYSESDRGKTVTYAYHTAVDIDHNQAPSLTVYDKRNGAWVSMVGVYGQQRVVEGNFVLADNQFFEVDSPVDIKAFRAYFHADDGVENKAPRQMRFLVDGRELGQVLPGRGQEASEPVPAQSEDFYYDIYGRRVNSPDANQRVYIHDGRKLIFK